MGALKHDGMEALVEKLVGFIELFQLVVGQAQLEHTIGAAAVDDAGVADKDLLAKVGEASEDR